ncbi:MAG: hypothetical protein PHW47_07780 [Lachnospira sp.]|nr:hypothetical protein [Lachnospira sp.]
MNKKIFNGKQFFQSWKQLKSVGIIFTLLLAVMMVVMPVSEMMSLKRNMELMGEGAVNLPYVVDVVSQATILIVTFILYTPLLTLMGWNFLTKRNASDFYQSQPYTRTCTYLTHAAAVIAWQVITLVVAGGMGAIAYAACSNYLLVDFGTMLHVVINIFACNLLCMAAITLACGLTGTIFSNICVTGLIIFLPRLLVKVVAVAAQGIVPVLSSENMYSVLGSDYNMLTEVIFRAMGIPHGGSFRELFISNTALVYTLILSVVYLIAAWFLFKKRRSETAGNSACSKQVQLIIRIVIGFVVSYIGVLGVSSAYRKGEMTGGDVMTLIVCFIVSLTMVMVYEGINTKSVNGAVKSIPSGILAIVISLIAGAVTYGLVIQTEKYQPSEADLDCVVMKANNYSYGYSEYDDYFDSYVSGIAIKNDIIEKILCDTLKDNIANITENGHSMDYNYINRRSEYTVGYHKGASTTYRTIYLTNSDVEKISAELVKVDSYKTAMLDLPEAKDASIQLNGIYVTTTAEQKAELYNTLLEESKEIAFVDWCSVVQDETRENGMISVVFSKEGTVYSANISISSKMPKTFAMFIRMTNKNVFESKNATLESCIQALSSTKAQNAVNNKTDIVEESVVLTFYDPQSDYVRAYYGLSDYMQVKNAEETLEKIAVELKKKNADHLIDITKPYIRVSYSGYEGNDYSGEYQSMTAFVQID